MSYEQFDSNWTDYIINFYLNMNFIIIYIKLKINIKFNEVSFYIFFMSCFELIFNYFIKYESYESNNRV